MPPNSRVWDLGSGDKAVALSQLVEQNPDQHLIGTGVTMPIERENLSHPGNVGVVRMDVDEYLKKFDRSQRPDLIYMSKLLRHVPNPLLTLKLAYNALQTDGILLVDEVRNAQSPLLDKNGTPVDPSVLGTFLKRQGYDIEIVPSKTKYDDLHITYSVAMKKTDNLPHLNLPVRVVTPEQIGIDPYSIDEDSPFLEVPEDIQFFYQYDPKSAGSTQESSI